MFESVRILFENSQDKQDGELNQEVQIGSNPFRQFTGFTGSVRRMSGIRLEKRRGSNTHFGYAGVVLEKTSSKQPSHRNRPTFREDAIRCYRNMSYAVVKERKARFGKPVPGCRDIIAHLFLFCQAVFENLAGEILTRRSEITRALDYSVCKEAKKGRIWGAKDIWIAKDAKQPVSTRGAKNAKGRAGRCGWERWAIWKGREGGGQGDKLGDLPLQIGRGGIIWLAVRHDV
jgi:hypothetical protein